MDQKVTSCSEIGCRGEREIVESLWKSLPIKAKFMVSYTYPGVIQVPNSTYQNDRGYDEIGL